MTEFQRLLESSPNRLTRALLRAGLEDRAPARGAERALVALGVGLAAQSAAAAAGAAGAGSAATAAVAKAGASSSGLLAPAALAKWFAIGIASGAGVASGASWVRHEPAEPAPLAASAATGAPARTSAVRRAGPGRAVAPRAPETTTEPAAAAVTLPAAPAGRDESQPKSRLPSASGTAWDASASAAKPSPPQNPVPELPAVAVLPREGGVLAREVALIDAARHALSSGAPGRALSELQRYEDERVTGTLDREALLLRIDALALSGQRAKAAELARGYLARFPKDAHAARLGTLALEP